MTLRITEKKLYVEVKDRKPSVLRILSECEEKTEHIRHSVRKKPNISKRLQTLI